MTFGFILRFHLPAGRTLRGVEVDRDVPLVLPDVSENLSIMQLLQKSNHRLGDPERFKVRGSGFKTEDTARKCGEKLKDTLLIFGFNSDVGVDVGRDQVTSGCSSIVKEEVRKQGVQVRDIVHGLDVFCEDLPVMPPYEISAIGSSRLAIENFFGKIAEEFDSLAGLPFQVRTALELYNLSKFETSSTTKFLTLIIIIEALATPRKNNSNTIKALSDLQKDVSENNRLSSEDRCVLLEGLNRLKKESISNACRHVVERHVDATAADYFKRCYNARSQMVHKGKSPPPDLIADSMLNAIVQKTLFSVLAEATGKKFTTKNQIQAVAS